MTIGRVLIANRGEIAVRIAQAAAEMGLSTVGLHAGDEDSAPLRRQCDEVRPLPGHGPRAYLDGAALIAAARDAGCDAIHPGYGFLSESSSFARAVQKAGLTFVGPDPDTLGLLGDKSRARALAQTHAIPVPHGLPGPVSQTQLHDHFATLPDGAALMLKAVSGGGGRGMRVLRHTDEIAAAFAACTAEAQAAFGTPDLYAERLIPDARHVEIQVLGDGTGAALHLGERDCTLQRRNQKLVEIAPAPGLRPQIRAALCDAALTLAQAVSLRGLCTFEFLLEGADQAPHFIEANPRLQVEHTITEMLYGADLVQAQFMLAAGATLAELGLPTTPRPGFALQARITTETLTADGAFHPTGGTITRYAAPTGPGLRVDGYVQTGDRLGTAYDPLLAKLIVSTPQQELGALLGKTRRALNGFGIEGVESNLRFLASLLARPELDDYSVTTGFVAGILPEIATEIGAAGASCPAADADGLTAPLQGTVVRIEASAGDRLAAGRTVVVLEAMKMEHLVTTGTAAQLLSLDVAVGETVRAGQLLARLAPEDGAQGAAETGPELDLDRVRPELAELRDRLAFAHDARRPAAVSKRHARGQSTAREILARLCNPESFREYGALALAAQRQRRSMEDLIANTTGDGIITGIGDVNAGLFGPERTRCAVAIYDYLVLAGTQGQRNHAKQDRLFQVAAEAGLPVILYAEGGGGRPGDSDSNAATGLDVPTFARFAGLSGQVPLIGVVSGRCFAGNAALLGCCDVIIATEDSNIGMAGPAMIEGGGLGRFSPEEIGPIGVQTRNGVVDIRVTDAARACAAATAYLSYLQGDLPDWDCADQRLLRHLIPENRKQVHDVRRVIETLADSGSVQELRPDYGIGIRTAMIRIEGRPYGLMANNALHLGGAIDGPAALKAARFMAQCNAAGLPILSLCDTPGFLVGPEAEATGLVRDVCQMFLSAARLTVPVFGVVLRKGYGLGAMAMVGGGFHENAFTLSWPTGEFGGMGLEGAVRLGFRKELEALTDPAEQQALFDRLVAKLYADGKALSIATGCEIDAVIDPAETRRWVADTRRNYG